MVHLRHRTLQEESVAKLEKLVTIIPCLDCESNIKDVHGNTFNPLFTENDRNYAHCSRFGEFLLCTDMV